MSYPKDYSEKKGFCEVHKKVVTWDECLNAHGCRCPWYGVCW